MPAFQGNPVGELGGRNCISDACCRRKKWERKPSSAKGWPKEPPIDWLRTPSETLLGNGAKSQSNLRCCGILRFIDWYGVPKTGTLKACRNTIWTLRGHRHEVVKTIEQINQRLIWSARRPMIRLTW